MPVTDRKRVISILLPVSPLARLRVELADSPGALAAVASVIGDLGGNIVAVDVHDGHADTAVDEILVDFAELGDVAGLRDALAESGAATLLSHQTARRADPVVQVIVRALEALRSPSLSDGDLCHAVGDLCSSPVVWVSTADEARQYGAGRFALERRGSVAMRSNELPAALTETMPAGEVWLLAVPEAGSTGRERVVFVARGLDLEFTATEIIRIEALISLFDELAKLRTPSR